MLSKKIDHHPQTALFPSIFNPQQPYADHQEQYGHIELNVQNYINDNIPNLFTEFVKNVLINTTDQSLLQLCQQYNSTITQIQQLNMELTQPKLSQKSLMQAYYLFQQSLEVDKLSQTLKSIELDIISLHKQVQLLINLQKNEKQRAKYALFDDQSQAIRQYQIKYNQLSKQKQIIRQQYRQNYHKINQLGQIKAKNQKFKEKKILKKRKIQKQIKRLQKLSFQQLIQINRFRQLIDMENARILSIKTQLDSKIATQTQKQINMDKQSQKNPIFFVQETIVRPANNKKKHLQILIVIWMIVCVLWSTNLLR